MLEGEERQQEWTEGPGSSVGGGVTEKRLVGTMAIVGPEVKGALEHAHRVALGFSSAPLLPCPIHPQLLLTQSFSRMMRRPLQKKAEHSGTTPFASNLPGAPAGPRGLPWAPGQELGPKQLPQSLHQLLPQGGAGSPQCYHRGILWVLYQLESLLTLGGSLIFLRRVATGGARGSTPMRPGLPPRRSCGKPTTRSMERVSGPPHSLPTWELRPQAAG